MYHYVRDANNSIFKKLNFLKKNEFEFQINFLFKNYNILSPKDVHERYSLQKKFSKNDCFLTFDDGYKDHLEVVMPILNKFNIKAFFFPPVISTLAIDVLDVNKIHHILAIQEDVNKLFLEIENIYNSFEINKFNKNFNDLSKKIDYSSGNRYDQGKKAIIKRLLQRDLPEKIRMEICNILFKKYVSKDIKSFAKDLYMSLDDIKKIKNYGHEVGLHGYNHSWYSSLSYKKQYEDINLALKFWKDNAIINDKWSICYPYGDFNRDTIKIVKSLNCNLGFTRVIPKNTGTYRSKLSIPRWDTNDFPKK